ncbi:MAG: hypothetical protein HC765_04745 [Brachymonas sp.]|nr:hypothetical protein [Brachymonas sp.]
MHHPEQSSTQVPVQPSAPPFDRREAQAVRAADYMEQHPEGVTVPQLQNAIDPGSASKLLSVMEKDMGYRFKRVPFIELCVGGSKQRVRRRYILLSRPAKPQPDLFDQ